ERFWRDRRLHEQRHAERGCWRDATDDVSCDRQGSNRHDAAPGTDGNPRIRVVHGGKHAVLPKPLHDRGTHRTVADDEPRRGSLRRLGHAPSPNDVPVAWPGTAAFGLARKARVIVRFPFLFWSGVASPK